eukprot:6331128-Lingulodinium_polyedra.AAC.1
MGGKTGLERPQRHLVAAPQLRLVARPQPEEAHDAPAVAERWGAWAGAAPDGGDGPTTRLR